MDSVEKRPPLFTNKALVSLSVPIVIDAVLVIITGMADAAMVSSAGEAASSAVSLVDQIFLLLVTAFSALATGGVVITSQYIGSGNLEKAKSSARQLLYGATAVALVITLALVGVIPQFLRLIYGAVEQAVFENAKVYFFYVLLGMPFLAVATSCTALLRTMARSKLALMLAFGANILNIIGNAVLIFGFHMGAAGAAIATTFSRIVWAVVGLVILHRKSLPVYFENLLRFRIEWDVMARVLKIGSVNSLESGLFQVGKLMVARLTASLATVYIAAYSVSVTISNIGWTITCSLGTVLLTVVGQCVGADQPQQAKDYTRKFMNLGHLLVAVLFGSMFLLRKQLVQLFDFAPETLELCAYYVGVSALVAIVTLYAAAFVPMAAFRAAGDVQYAALLAVASMFAFRVGLSYLLHEWFNLGLLGIWIGMGADWIFRAVCNIIRFRNGKWLKKKLI